MSKLRLLSFLSLLGVTTVACQREPKPAVGLMLKMRTDLAVPKPVHWVGVYVERIVDQQRQVIFATEVEATQDEAGNKKVKLPAQLAVQGDGEPNTRVRVRVVAYGGEDGSDVLGAPLVMREARVPVPTDAIRALSLPLLWMNTDDVRDSTPTLQTSAREGVGAQVSLLAAAESVEPSRADAFSRFRSDYCASDETLDDEGDCRGIDDFELLPWSEEDGNEAEGPTDNDRGGVGVPPTPEYQGLGGCFVVESSSERGFCAQGKAASCFDLERCVLDRADDEDEDFRPVSLQPAFEDDGCWAQLPEGLQLGDAIPAIVVRTAEGEGGERCVGGSCYVPIESARVGLDAARGRLSLPPGLCRRFAKNSNFEVLATPLCAPPNHEQQGLCGAGQSSCLDGTSWSGQSDRVTGERQWREPECVDWSQGGVAGTPTSLWSSDGPNPTVSVITAAGNLLTLPAQHLTYLPRQNTDYCLASCLAPEVVHIEGIPEGDDGRYRLFGDSEGARSFLGVGEGQPSGVVAGASSHAIVAGEGGAPVLGVGGALTLRDAGASAAKIDAFLDVRQRLWESRAGGVAAEQSISSQPTTMRDDVVVMTNGVPLGADGQTWVQFGSNGQDTIPYLVSRSGDVMQRYDDLFSGQLAGMRPVFAWSGAAHGAGIVPVLVLVKGSSLSEGPSLLLLQWSQPSGLSFAGRAMLPDFFSLTNQRFELDETATGRPLLVGNLREPSMLVMSAGSGEWDWSVHVSTSGSDLSLAVTLDTGSNGVSGAPTLIDSHLANAEEAVPTQRTHRTVLLREPEGHFHVIVPRIGSLQDPYVWPNEE